MNFIHINFLIYLFYIFIMICKTNIWRIRSKCIYINFPFDLIYEWDIYMISYFFTKTFSFLFLFGSVIVACSHFVHMFSYNIFLCNTNICFYKIIFCIICSFIFVFVRCWIIFVFICFISFICIFIIFLCIIIFIFLWINFTVGCMKWL